MQEVPGSSCLCITDDEVTQGVRLLLQSHAAPGDVLYLLRALAAWQDEVRPLPGTLLYHLTASAGCLHDVWCWCLVGRAWVLTG
jgi:hypothetical protein